MPFKIQDANSRLANLLTHVAAIKLFFDLIMETFYHIVLNMYNNFIESLPERAAVKLFLKNMGFCLLTLFLILNVIMIVFFALCGIAVGYINIFYAIF